MSRSTTRILLQDSPIGYHPCLAKVGGGVAEAVLLRQLLYWDKTMSDARGKDWTGWFYKSAESFQEETGMSRTEFETARKNLVDRKLIETKKQGIPCTTHYRVDLDRIEEELEHPSNNIADSRQKSLQNLRKPVCRESTNKDADNLQPIQEIKQEIESEENNDIEGDATFQENEIGSSEKTEKDVARDFCLAAMNETDLNGNSEQFESLWERFPSVQLFQKASYAITVRRKIRTEKRPIRDVAILVERLSRAASP